MQLNESNNKRITAWLIPEANERLRAECVRRLTTEAAVAPIGRILTELIMQYLPATNGEPVPVVRVSNGRPDNMTRKKRKPDAANE